MKNLKQYGLLAVLLSCSMLVHSEVKNFVGLWGQVGEWSLLANGDNKTAPSMGLAGGLGFTYDMQVKHFILNLGVGGDFGQTSFDVNRYALSLARQADPWGNTKYTFQYTYELNDRKDAYMNASLQIPVLAGAQFGRFYFLAGAKINMSLWSQCSTTGLLTTYGAYYQGGGRVFIGDGDGYFRNQPTNQFYTDYSIPSQTSKTSFNIDVDASVEIGARLGFMTDHTGFDVPKSKVQYRIALFADYGLLDMHNPGDNKALETPSAYVLANADNKSPMLNGLKSHDIISTEGFANSVNNLFIGVKFTVLFELPKVPNCLICRDAYRSLVKSSKGGGKIEE